MPQRLIELTDSLERLFGTPSGTRAITPDLPDSDWALICWMKSPPHDRPVVRKIDHQTVPLLLEELKIPSRTRRLRAVQVAVATNSVADVEESLLELLKNDDHVLRLEIVRALAACDSSAVREALSEAQNDRSELVRQAAAGCLASIQRRARTQPPLPPIDTDTMRDTYNGHLSSS